MIHICFDLDGTLIDSIPLMRASWENLCSKLDLKIGWSIYKKNIGLPFDKICENLNIVTLKEEVRELYFSFNKKNIALIEPMPGLWECIDWINLENVEWSIITSKPRYTTYDILNKFELNPAFVITCDDTPLGKPTILPADLLRENISDEVNKIYYIGDTIVDHIFSLNANFKFIEFIDSRNSDYIFEDKKSGFILNNRPKIHNLKDIKNLIKMNGY
ncbi:HAD family hydrolase [Polynucleobacter antarcticus]|uniref:phosphoglycolate phosphatase n=1 Tax=Polynucleobacter antarcticus TaxID=1743162 RepID=A0A6M9PNC7_9BURK|nr:HAD family hydrolase [Polynucleobacter antarcticus]QKM61901.1 hypothetical protein DCO16_01655 [Polynucleobacter antarcticus]